MSTGRVPRVHGVLVVDKPKGITSHDVVRAVRRALRLRAVGHAGTLDPMATGVLVLGLGEGTKLLHHLSADDKTYLATITLGSETDTLDAEGQPVAFASLPVPLDRVGVEAATQRFLGAIVQTAPKVSAIKQDGVALHERVRRGEDVVAPERDVFVHEIEVLDVRPDEIDLRVRSGKGFYVRSLARDLALALGTRGHLSALRRVASGAFDLNDTTSFELVEDAKRDASALEALTGKLMPLAAAMRGAPVVKVTAEGKQDVRNGRAFGEARLLECAMPGADVEPVAIVCERGELIAIGRCRAGQMEIVRGILLPEAQPDPHPDSLPEGEGGESAGGQEGGLGAGDEE